eukprot:Platyproteum_vivax@DN6136_c0_g1_i2.p1
MFLLQVECESVRVVDADCLPVNHLLTANIAKPLYGFKGNLGRDAASQKSTTPDGSDDWEREDFISHRQLCKQLTLVQVEIHSGRMHIVRRLLAHVGLPILQLHRVQFGGVNLYDIGLKGPRDAVILPEEAVGQLWQSIGGNRKAWLKRAWAWKLWLKKETSYSENGPINPLCVKIQQWLNEVIQNPLVEGYFEEMSLPVLLPPELQSYSTQKD